MQRQKEKLHTQVMYNNIIEIGATLASLLKVAICGNLKKLMVIEQRKT